MTNRKRTQTLYQEGLAARRRHNRPHAIGPRAPARVLAVPNQRRGPGLVHDQMALGRRFWVLNVVDGVTKECRRQGGARRSPVGGWCGN